MKRNVILGRPAARALVARRKSRRPRLEHLEDRRLLADYTAATVPELIASINAANASAEDDTITLAAPTFALTAPDNYENGTSVLPPIAANGGLTINGNGATIELVSDLRSERFRLINVSSGAAATLNDLTLRGGTGGSGSLAVVGGGAILNEGELRMTNVVLRDNISQGADSAWFPTGIPAQGGAIYSLGVLAMENCVLQDNLAIGANNSPEGLNQPGRLGGDGYGGGLFVAGGTATLTNCMFTGNTAQGGSGGRGRERTDGGGQGGQGGSGFNGGDGGNGFGGGLYVDGGSVVLRQVTITGNKAVGGFGGDAPKPSRSGKAGVGEGGGIYIGALASVGLDTFTVEHVTNNTGFPKKKSDIVGSYTVIA
jgi:hypothetical protein